MGMGEGYSLYNLRIKQYSLVIGEYIHSGRMVSSSVWIFLCVEIQQFFHYDMLCLPPELEYLRFPYFVLQ